MRKLLLSAVLAMALECPASATATDDTPQCTNCFIGELRLGNNPKDNSGNTKVLQSDLYFVTADKTVWKAGKGDITDGASIPKLFQPIIGGSFEEDYLPAAVMHDHYTDKEHRVRTWQSTDRMFYAAMIVRHVDVIKAKLMYYAVYAFGPHWDTLKAGQVCGPNCVFAIEDKTTFQPADYDVDHTDELNEVGARIEEKEINGDPDNLAQIEELARTKHPDNVFFINDTTR